LLELGIPADNTGTMTFCAAAAAAVVVAACSSRDLSGAVRRFEASLEVVPDDGPLSVHRT
jgi:hypothetical protein